MEILFNGFKSVTYLIITLYLDQRMALLDNQGNQRKLRGNQDIVFKVADKGGGWVIMDKNYYWDKIVKVHLLSNVYKKVSIDSDKKVFNNLKEYMKKYESILTKKETI